MSLMVLRPTSSLLSSHKALVRRKRGQNQAARVIHQGQLQRLAQPLVKLDGAVQEAVNSL